jgi:hypothetical protein
MAAGTIGPSVFPLKVEILVSFPHNTELVFRIFDRKFAHLALEPAHLDTFLNGVTADEPPTYKHFNDATYPPLAQVTVKEEATSFDLGNVLFPEGDGKTYRAYLTVEGGTFAVPF